MSQRGEMNPVGLEYVKITPFFRFDEDFYIPELKGSTLRGMFKTSLRRVCCALRQGRCEECMLARKCAYAMLTEHRTETGENTVLPYAISNAELEDDADGRGRRFAFDFLLVGSAVAYFPYVVYSFSQWAKLDVGRFQPLVSDEELSRLGPPQRWPKEARPRGRLCLDWVQQGAGDGRKEVCSTDGLLTEPDVGVLTWEVEPGIVKHRVEIEFLSPTRILRKIAVDGGRKKKTLIGPESFDFGIFFRALVTRFSGLYQYFGHGDEDFGRSAWESLKEDVEGVEIEENELRLEKVRRYRGNMTRWTHLDGFVGRVVFKNVSGALIPWIQAGEVLQIGKFPTMGFGEYRAGCVREEGKENEGLVIGEGLVKGW